MTLSEMAAEYRASASLLRGRITELRSQLDNGGMCEMDKLRLRLRIDALETMFRETSEVAVNLERYYDRGHRRSARLTV